MMNGQVKHNAAGFKIVGVVLLVCVLLIIGLLGSWILFVKSSERAIDKIPVAQAEGETVTLLRTFKGSVMRDINYYVSDESMLEKDDFASYRKMSFEKCGYTFTALKPGQVYVAWYYFPKGASDFVECELYEVLIGDELNTSVELKSTIQKDTVEELQDCLIEEYGFDSFDM